MRAAPKDALRAGRAIAGAVVIGLCRAGVLHAQVAPCQPSVIRPLPDGVGQRKAPCIDDLDTAAVVHPAALPVFPPTLLSAKVDGAVRAQFVVTGDGRIDSSTFRVLKSTHDLFTQSVRRALVHWTARPARLHGKPVAQWFQTEVHFETTCDTASRTPRSIATGATVIVCGKSVGVAPDDDTLLVRAVLESVLGNMGPELSYVVESASTQPWTIHVPAGSAWVRSALGLHRLLNARAVLPRDTIYNSLEIQRTARGDSTAAYDIGVGRHFHCPHERVRWNGSGESFQITARRGYGGYWSTSTTLVTMSDPGECS